MNQRSFGSLFGPYMSGFELSAALASGQVESMDIDHGAGKLQCTVSFESLVSMAEIQTVENLLAQALRIHKVSLRPQYAPELFNEDCLPELIALLKKANVAVNGTFEDAVFEISENTLRVNLSHGGVNILHTTGAAEQLQKLIYVYFKRRMQVEFVGEDSILPSLCTVLFRSDIGRLIASPTIK